MAEKIRVTNKTRYGIGLMLLNGLGMNIPGGATMPFSKDDIEYNFAKAPKLFMPPAQLEIQDEQMNIDLGLAFATVEYSTDETEIKKRLGGSAKNLEKWIKDINEPHMLEAIYQAAKGLDLAQSKMKVLKEKMPDRYTLDDE